MTEPERRWAVIDAGPHRCALDAADVCEVHDGCAIEPLPGTADWFLGTATVHGRVLPVTDLAAWLGRSARRPPPNRSIEIAGGEHRYLLAVDAIRLVTEAATGDDAVDGEAGSSDAAGADLAAALDARGVDAATVRIEGRSLAVLRPAALLRAPAFLHIRDPG